MARNYAGESEFGLPAPMSMYAADGSVVDGTDPAGVLPVATNDREAIETGADLSAADELRRIYATNPDDFGPREPKAGTS